MFGKWRHATSDLSRGSICDNNSEWFETCHDLGDEITLYVLSLDPNDCLIAITYNTNYYTIKWFGVWLIKPRLNMFQEQRSNSFFLEPKPKCFHSFKNRLRNRVHHFWHSSYPEQVNPPAACVHSKTIREQFVGWIKPSRTPPLQSITLWMIDSGWETSIRA